MMKTGSKKHKDFPLSGWIKSVYRHISPFIQSERGKLWGRITGYLIQATIIGYFLYQLSKIGWETLVGSLPTTPLFYLFFLTIYFALPISEITAYKQSWQMAFIESFPVFIKKRVFNKMLVGYSGEFFTFSWAKAQNKGTDRQIFKVIRDNNIVSSAASTSLALILLLVFITTGQIILPDFVPNNDQIINFSIGGIILIVLLIVAYVNRKYLFSMSKKVAFSVFAIHFLRLFIVMLAQILEWHVVLPDTPYEIWFTYLSLQIIINRIPFLPNKDLIFIGTGTEMAGYLDIPVARLTGMLLMHGALDKILNVVLYLAISLRERRAAALNSKEHDNPQEVNEPIG